MIDPPRSSPGPVEPYPAGPTGSAADAESAALLAEMGHAGKLLWERIEPWLPGLKVEVVAEADSTNTRLVARVRDDPTPILLVALRQTQGRGRLGRAWHSTPGASLTFSLAMPLAPADWSGLSLAVGVAIAEALSRHADVAAPQVALKWPNDLFVCDAPGRGRKLGGVLVETLSAGGQRVAVVGVGINLQPQELADVATGVASLEEIAGVACAAPRVLARVAPALVRALLDFEQGGFAVFQGRWRQRDLIAGHSVSTSSPDLPAGLADGVDSSGALRILTDPDDRASLYLLHAGEVSVRCAA
jgi:BirA family biotin operon repressor/biotin-[acetyl-CoA-carboxylase] ligase